VVAERVADSPHLVQVTRQGPCGADDDVLVIHGLVGGTYDLILRRQRCVAGFEGLIHDGIPPLLLSRHLLFKIGSNAVTPQGPVKLHQGLARVCDDRQHSAVLIGVDRGDVDVHELHIRVLERRTGSSGEVLVARADPDDEVRLGSDRVGSRRTR
jgi:hypothetical protein